LWTSFLSHWELPKDISESWDLGGVSLLAKAPLVVSDRCRVIGMEAEEIEEVEAEGCNDMVGGGS
jgi:hypothetical protein